MPTREDLIEMLVADWMDSIRQDATSVEHVLRHGFVGYHNMSLESLEQEARDADIIEDGCSNCDAPLDDGEGYGGLCGGCADREETKHTNTGRLGLTPEQREEAGDLS